MEANTELSQELNDQAEDRREYEKFLRGTTLPNGLDRAFGETEAANEAAAIFGADDSAGDA